MLRVLAIVPILLALPLLAWSQAPLTPSSPHPLIRLSVGTLNPDDPFRTTFAFGASAGLEWGDRRAVLIRVIRQSQNRNVGTDGLDQARTFLTVDAEVGGSPAARRKQQLRGRLGLGVLLRPDGLRPALAASGGVAIRYEVLPRFSFVGQIEDDVAALPRQEFESCRQAYSPTFGNAIVNICDSFIQKGMVQHNFGLIVALEWRP